MQNAGYSRERARWSGWIELLLQRPGSLGLSRLRRRAETARLSTKGAEDVCVRNRRNMPAIHRAWPLGGTCYTRHAHGGVDERRSGNFMLRVHAVRRAAAMVAAPLGAE